MTLEAVVPELPVVGLRAVAVPFVLASRCMGGRCPSSDHQQEDRKSAKDF